jgi:iron complex transport system permease protein
MRMSLAVRPAALSRPWSQLPLLRFAILPILVLGTTVLATAYGATTIPLRETWDILLGQVGLPVAHTWSATDAEIILQVRLPEVVTALLVGAALAVSGVILQAVLRNPLADPFSIGTSGGAAFGAAVAITMLPAGYSWALGFGPTQVLAFLGALAAVAVVYWMGRVGSTTPVLTLVLAGFAVSTLMAAATWVVVYEGGRTATLLAWTLGSLSNAEWSQLELIAPVILVFVAASFFFARDLNAMLLGETQASHLGVSTERVKIAMVILTALLTALAVSISGIIGFVGLVIPHVARLLYGPNHRLLLPAAACLGGAFLALADMLSRTVQGSGGQLPLSIVTAAIGVPFFLYLLRRTGDAYRF